MGHKNIVRQLWDGLVDSLNQKVSETTEEVERAISFMRLREQLWDALDSSAEVSAGGWAFPIDVFYGENNDLFAIVTQTGKLYQVPMTINGENVTLGTWQQVTEVFEPVTQTKNSFTITRDKTTGLHRWLFVAATAVINRVGEIDSTSLFDSFIEDANETGDYPRVDFYHLGSADPDAWEFGTADYLAREGNCYIASGLFDEDHPLAKATIRAYEAEPEKWGCSIEFYARGKPEIILMDPKVQVPVYKEGKNTRISVVRECDAAGLFTRVASITEEKVRMKRDIMEVLAEFFGDDQEALDKFAENVDSINRTIQTDGLIARTKKARTAKAADPNEGDEDEEDDEEEDTEDTEEDSEDLPLELDDEAIQQVAKQVEKSGTMTTIQQSLEKLQASIDALTAAQTANTNEIAAIKKQTGKTETRLKNLEKDEDEKLQEKLEDLPSRRTRKATYQRPRDIHEAVDEDPDDLAAQAQRTLSKLPSY